MMSDRPLIKQGWLRALLFLIPWILSTVLAQAAAEQLVLAIWGQNAPMGDNPQTVLTFFIAAVVAALVVWLWRKLVDRRSFFSLGFAWQKFSVDAFLGFFTGPALLGLGCLVLTGLGFLQFDAINFNPAQFGWQLALMVCVAFTEELIVRGYLLNNLLQSLNRWIALGITSVFFAALHLANPDVTALSVINIFAAGFLLGINYIYTKNLWFGILLHLSWNFFQGPVFGFDVSGLKTSGILQQTLSGPIIWSGGAFGFEGSLLCTVLIILATVMFAIHFSKKYKAEVMGEPSLVNGQ